MGSFGGGAQEAALFKVRVGLRGGALFLSQGARGTDEFVFAGEGGGEEVSSPMCVRKS